MLFRLPDHDTLYTALLSRDPSYDGHAYVAVTTTGIFCRLTCPARKPKSENCQFFDTIADCIQNGFRPCKRCHPLGPGAETDLAIQTLLTALAKNPARRWLERDITNLGFDPSTIRRSFKRHFGITFLDMARASRLKGGFTTLANGGKMIEAQLDAGFSSPSAFRTAFAKLLGASPASFTNNAILKADWIETPLGSMIAVSDKSHLHLLEFSDRKALPKELQTLRRSVRNDIGIGRYEPTEQISRELAAFFDGKSAQFTTQLALHGSPFSHEVWKALCEIPAGKTRSYSDIAKSIGNPTAARAVAHANGANMLAIVIPCHRVISADGSLTGYGGGLWRKQKLIEIERQYLHKR